MTILSKREPFLKAAVDSICSAYFFQHPFENITEKHDEEWILANYLAMSQAFPYLQAGAQKELIFDVIAAREEVPYDFEITAAIMNFLCWDETGGHFAVLENGQAGLKNILDTANRFHSNILKDDLEKLFGKGIKPNYSLYTRRYLMDLYAQLSQLDSVKRVAAMVAFERHAHQMITALWKSLSPVANIDKNSLRYFKMHVGDDDPAEAYHVDLTFQMIDKVVDIESEQRFYNAFRESYEANVTWCGSLMTNAEVFR
jgi:hypothetical protein